MTEIRVETLQDNVRVLVLSRESRRNALSRQLIAGLHEQVRVAEVDGMRALVIAGQGKAFSAGADFSDLQGDQSDEQFDAAMSGLTSALMHSSLISIAAINGACIGAGLDLAMACDFRVAAPDAFFALPIVKMGILYHPGRLAELLSAMNDAAARRLLLLSDTLSCEDAWTAGIVTHRAGQAGGDAPLSMAVELASRAASLPPQAQNTAKGFIRSFRAPDFNEADWQARRRERLNSDERKAALLAARR